MPPFRILVVEDNLDAAQSLTMVLTMWGYLVQTVPDAPSALGIASTFMPDVVLSDLGLPGMSGFSLAEKLAAKGILLIATTAYGDSASRKASKDAGFHEHLVKPLDLDLLHRVLEQHRRSAH
jgi:CheY-like chemotaxis protein